MSFESLSKDELHPVSDFENEFGHYEKAQAFWDDGFKAVLGDDSSGWTDWMDDPFKDGHPILSKLCKARFRAVLVQQVPRSNDPVWFKCWVATIESGDSDMPYLFVETFISEAGRRLFQALVHQWCVLETDLASMARLTEAVRMGKFDAEKRTSIGR